MYLTPQQEREAVERYDKLVRSVVYNFRKRISASLDNYDDMYQECMLVLLESIRKYPYTTGYRPPIKDMIHALCHYTLGEQILSYPKRTNSYKRVINSASTKVDYKVVDTNALFASNTIQDCEDRIACREFLDTLTPEERMLVHLKLEGGTNRYAARISGLPEMTVSRRIKGVYEKYKKFIAA